MGDRSGEGRGLMPDDKVQVAVVGYGYWGPNIVRNLL